MQQQTPPNMLQPAEEMTPKRQAVVNRLKRRLDAYRKRQSETLPRCDQSFSVACEQQNMETTALQKRFFEGKTKRVVKKGPPERKPDLPPMHTINNLHSSVHVQQKFGCGDYEPTSKMTCGGGGGGGGSGGGAGGNLRGEGLTKFSVEIVQQLEFTTSAADSHAQQISTNVTVKALTNAAVKSDTSSPPPPPARAVSPLDCKRECKSEAPDDDLYGLDECAAMLERDAFPGLADLIGNSSAAIEDLITEISEYPEFMKNFELDGGGGGGGAHAHAESEAAAARLAYGAPPELSPAAQTLKQMAEQHQQAAAAEWGARYRPHAARGRHDHLHVAHPHHHHNLQVSAGQHMQVNGDGARAMVAAQQGMYANFAHSPQGGAVSPLPHDSYTMSQSQTINFGRQRQQSPHHSANMGSIVAAGLSHELQAKMMQQQQQQMLRQQQLRPPPPEYKQPAAPLYAHAHAHHPPPLRKAPPARFAYHDYLPRHVQGVRHPYAHHQGGFNMGPMGGGGGGGGGQINGGMTLQQQQMQQQLQQQARLQQHQMMQQQQQQQQQQQRQNQQQQGAMNHLVMQQNQAMSAHGQMSNIHMSQSQSISLQAAPPAHPFPAAAPADFMDVFNSIADDTTDELLSSLDNDFLDYM